eukprot:scaffold2897_cov178-Amphora_coffeaeformis.AAC.11
MSISEALDSFFGVNGSLGVSKCRREKTKAGYVIKSAFMFQPEPEVENLDEEEEKEPPRNFTPQQLLYYDGKPDKDGEVKPVYLSVNGIVFDMSKGRDFYGPGGPYERFAGHECGMALAKMSFDDQHLDNLAGCASLNFGEKTELDNWIEKFQYYRNYPIVGRLVPTLPAQKEWTVEDMTQANQGKTPEGYATAPIYIAAKGKVFDMSFGGVTFYGPEGPYRKFAGRDASRALAKMSLDEADLQNPDLSDVTEKEMKVLDDWVRKFEQAKGYPIVGTFKKK